MFRYERPQKGVIDNSTRSAPRRSACQAHMSTQAYLDAGRICATWVYAMSTYS